MAFSEPSWPGLFDCLNTPERWFPFRLALVRIGVNTSRRLGWLHFARVTSISSSWGEAISPRSYTSGLPAPFLPQSHTVREI